MTDLDSASAGAPHSLPPSVGRRALRLVLGVGLALGLVAAVVLRFTAQPDLWLDEALTVNIARLPLDQLRDALLRDGAPPLYYVLLHGWTAIFGTGSVAVRALSGIFGVVAIGLAYGAGTRLGRTGAERRWLGAVAMIIVAVSPYAIHYATEARMYSLAMVLVLLGVIVGVDAWWMPTWPRLLGVAVIVGALLLTQYWSFFLVGVVGIGLAVAAIRRHPSGVRLLGAVVGGCVLFLPWVPTFRTQLAHTGTPWDDPISVVGGTVKAVVAFGGGRNPEGWPQIALLVALFVLAVIVLAVGARRTEPLVSGAALAVAGAGIGTFVLGIGYSAIAEVGFQDRYAAVVFPLVALTVAVGVVAISDLRVRIGLVVVLAGLGLLGGVRAERRVRTPSGAVAVMLSGELRPDDVVVYCPDQLGPSTARLLPASVRQVTFPDLGAPEFVDWTDYADRNAAARPRRFAANVAARADAARIWFVWSPGYRTFGTKCEAAINDLGRLRTPAPGTRSFAGPDGDTVEVRRFDP